MVNVEILSCVWILIAAHRPENLRYRILLLLEVGWHALICKEDESK